MPKINIRGTMKRYKSPYLENEKRTKSDSDRRTKNRRDQSNEPLWGELIKALGPEIKDFLITTAENHKRMTIAQEQCASAEERIAESIAELVEIIKNGVPVKGLQSGRKKSVKRNDKRHQEVKQIILKMREKGETFESIVEYLEKKGIPTFTGRGKWHAQTVHRLYVDYFNHA
jgi:hypothetical protein